MENIHTDDNTLPNAVLTGFAALFFLIESSTADEIYTWTFRVLTLLSLTLIIIINCKKAYLTIFNKKK